MIKIYLTVFHYYLIIINLLHVLIMYDLLKNIYCVLYIIINFIFKLKIKLLWSALLNKRYLHNFIIHTDLLSLKFTFSYKIYWYIYVHENTIYIYIYVHGNTIYIYFQNIYWITGIGNYMQHSRTLYILCIWENIYI